MAKILRCPACGALWRLSGELPHRCRCGECGTVFTTDKAEMVEVDDEKLQAKMAERAALAAAEEKKREREAQEAREGEALMTKLAADMSAFEGGAQDTKHAAPAEQNAREPAFAASASEASSDDRAGRTENKGGAFSRFLLGLVSIAAVVVIAACAALYCHEPVLKAVPYLRPVYENVCTKLPCPGFVWAQPLAFEAAAELVPGETVDLKRPDVRVTLRNSSAHPQRLPIIEMKLLDPAGDTIVQRILEPAEYGVAAQNAVLPAGESMTVLVHVETPLPYEAASAVVSPVEMQ